MYRIDDEHGNEVGVGFVDEDEAVVAAKRWAKRTGRNAYVSEDVSVDEDDREPTEVTP